MNKEIKLGTYKFRRKRNGQFKKGSTILPTIAFVFVIVLAITTYFHWETAQAWFDQQDVKYENVVEVDDRDTEQKVADNLAEAMRDLKDARATVKRAHNALDEAQALENEAIKAYNEAISYVETISK
jgi:F0F1-type ATP synthase membrane subunit b/b'